MRKFEIVDKNFIKYNENDTKLPQRATSFSACYDLYSPIDIEIEPDHSFLIWTNIKAQFNENESLLIFSRSGFSKYDIRLTNCVGVIDCDYYNNINNNGNIGINLRNSSKNTFKVNKGDRIAQAMFINYLTVENDCVSNKIRTNGFGSTGLK